MVIERPKLVEIVVKLRQVEVLMGQGMLRIPFWKTDFAKASTDGCETNCSTENYSTRCVRPK